MAKLFADELQEPVFDTRQNAQQQTWLKEISFNLTEIVLLMNATGHITSRDQNSD